MVTLANTIVAGNMLIRSGRSGPDVYGTVVSLGYNLIGNNADSSGWVSTDLLNVSNPGLSPLGNYGGPTQTIALVPGSPAIGAGDLAFVTNPPFSGPPFTDQRGQPRVVDNAVDIGAFESQGFTITISSGDNQSAGIYTAFASPLYVSVTSADGTPVEGGVVTFTAPQSGPSCTFAGGSTTVSINTSGQASITVAANGIIGGPYTVSATSEGAFGRAEFSLTNTPGPPNQLVIHTQPSPTAMAGQLFATGPVVYVEDQYGNVDTDDNSTQVSVSLRVGAGPLLGTTTVTVSGGIATFTNLRDDKVESIVLVFTSFSLVKATSNSLTVNPAAASRLSISAPATAAIDTPFNMTITAFDPYGNEATGFYGTVHFQSSDGLAWLPRNYTFTPKDGGVHTFGNSVNFKTKGMQTVSVIDTANPSIMGNASVQVRAGNGNAAAVAAGSGTAAGASPQLLRARLLAGSSGGPEQIRKKDTSPFFSPAQVVREKMRVR